MSWSQCMNPSELWALVKWCSASTLTSDWDCRGGDLLSSIWVLRATVWTWPEGQCALITRVGFGVSHSNQTVFLMFAIGLLGCGMSIGCSTVMSHSGTKCHSVTHVHNCHQCDLSCCEMHRHQKSKYSFEYMKFIFYEDRLLNWLWRVKTCG